MELLLLTLVGLRPDHHSDPVCLRSCLVRLEARPGPSSPVKQELFVLIQGTKHLTTVSVRLSLSLLQYFSSSGDCHGTCGNPGSQRVSPKLLCRQCSSVRLG